MNLENSSQIRFLKTIQQLIPAHVSLVNELATLLNISNDSAYRRIRAETALSFDEIASICQKYKVSFDAFNGFGEGDIVSFQYHMLDDDLSKFKNYFLRLKEDITVVKEAATEEKHVLFAGQGIPIFHYLKFANLTAFKMFYWMKSIINIQGFDNIQYKPEHIEPELIDLGKSIFKQYLHIPSTEIWTDTTVLGTLHQIQFYWDSGIFASKQIALDVCADVRNLLIYVQKMAETGIKQDDFESPGQFGKSLHLYFSEIEFENNCIVVNIGDRKRVYIGQQSFGTLSTENIAYCIATEKWLQNILRKSNLISGAADTMRFQFFKRSLRHLEKLEQRIQED